MAKLMSAVNFMHFQGVVHRDLKPEVNIMEVVLLSSKLARMSDLHVGCVIPASRNLGKHDSR